MDEEKRSWLDDARAALDGPLLFLGAMVGAASGISAIARLLDVGLIAVLHDFVQFYRGLLSPLYQWVNLLPLPFHVPPSAVELFAVYAMLVGMGVRAEALRPHLALDEHIGAVENLRSLTQSVFRERWERQLGDVDELATAFINTAHHNWRGHIGAAAWVRCFLLVPVLSLEPVTLLVRGAAVSKDGEWRFARKRFNQLLFRDFAAFVSLPAAIIVFFVVNAYISAAP